MTQRNTPERATMLLERRTKQELREYGIWEEPGRPFTTWERPKLIPAWANRRSGKVLVPHTHARAKARRLRQIGLGT